MLKTTGEIVLFLIIIGAIGFIPVFASPALLENMSMTNSSPGNTNSSLMGVITVTTDKPSYNDGDKIIISGSTLDYVSDTPITLIIRNPIGNVVKVDQLPLGSDKTFSTTINAGGSILWQAAGTYDVSVQFGSKDRSAHTTFEFAGSAGGQTGQTIKVGGTDFSVKYSIINGTVLGIMADIQAKSLVVSIQTTGNGLLTMTLPRGLINATQGGMDTKFIVLNDGQENIMFQETSTTPTERTLSIPFNNGALKI
jgi:hypothetical protein